MSTAPVIDLDTVTFASLGVSPGLCTVVSRLGYATPTPVQRGAIPIVLRGHDLIARAQTGTGKTAAFALPLLDLLRQKPAAGRTTAPRVLVLVPTRELAVQVERAFRNYASGTGLRTAAIFGGVSMFRQIDALRSGVDVVVATPGRLIDHVQRRTVQLSSITALVVDEADRMLDVGFLPALRRLVGVLPKARQTLLFSATFPAEVTSLAAEMTRTPERVDVSSQAVAPTVTHELHPVSDQRKGDLLAHVLKISPDGQALVFCRTKRGSDRVSKTLERAGVQSTVIHGNKSQSARTRALDGFRAGRVRVLVATDIAARGIDIPQLPLVINYDLPHVPEDYIHRIGRTGRAGLPGRAISLVSGGDRDLVRDIQKLLPERIAQIALDGFALAAGEEVSSDRTSRQAPWGRRPASPSRHAQPSGPGRRQHRSFRPRRSNTRPSQ